MRLEEELEYVPPSFRGLRLGGIMNALQESYALLSNRTREEKSRIGIDDLAFRYADNLPCLYQDFQLKVEPRRPAQGVERARA
jgi:hypothetical protein